MLTGAGASMYGGRWNSIGVPAIYAAESRIMAILEIVIRQPIDKIAAEFRLIPIEIGEQIFEPVLPDKWRGDESISREIGDTILREPNTLVFKVPSALLSHSFNYVINPSHPHINTTIKVLETEKILLDDRLLSILSKT